MYKLKIAFALIWQIDYQQINNLMVFSVKYIFIKTIFYVKYRFKIKSILLGRRCRTRTSDKYVKQYLKIRAEFAL